MRSNDGAVDSAGRFWLGTMNDPKEAKIANEAVLFRLDTNGSLHRILEKALIPNGISWNDKDDTMYWTDTPTNNVYAFDFDADTGNISNRRVFYHHPEDGYAGSPDGHARDVNGNMWHACYGGSKVIKISPEGNLIGEILIPTRNPTCPVFVGTELFITTAKEDQPEKYPESARYGGGVFRLDVGVEGMPKHKARIPESS
jgi:sugar lactone lactonase YvrE